MRTAFVNGVRIGYERAGEGPPVLLAGGVGMAPRAWREFGVRDGLVRAGYEVVTYAARGVRPSEASPAPYSIDQLAADAAALTEELRLGAVCAVGYSLGGCTVEALARSRPDLVRGAVLLASAGPTTPVMRAGLRMDRELIGRLGRLPPASSAFQSLFTGLSPAMLADDELVNHWLCTSGGEEAGLDESNGDWATGEGERGQAAAADAWLRDDGRLAALRVISVPVLLAAYEWDPLFPPRTVRQAVELIPRAEFVEIPGAAHAGPATHPEETLRVLVDFLRRVA